MEKLEAINKLTEIFRKVLDDDSILLKDELTANDVDGWDSLSHMLIITEIERLFQIRFKLNELNKLNNIGNLLLLVSSKIAQK